MANGARRRNKPIRIPLGMQRTRRREEVTVSFVKLEIFIPETHLAALQAALQEADAGHIGNYDCCLAFSPVTGTWRPLPGTKPFIGEEGQISCEPELKVEVTVRVERLDETMEAIRKIHPYEEPVINIIPLWGTSFSWKRDKR